MITPQRGVPPGFPIEKPGRENRNTPSKKIVEISCLVSIILIPGDAQKIEGPTFCKDNRNCAKAPTILQKTIFRAKLSGIRDTAFGTGKKTKNACGEQFSEPQDGPQGHYRMEVPPPAPPNNWQTGGKMV
jgi:hypothetical protein